jgi:peptide deformylase
MVRDIVIWPDPILKQIAKPVDRVDDTIRRLLDDMAETMYAADGVGLAAPQVGVSLQLAVVDISVGEDPSQLLVLINPEIVAQAGKQVDEEGCLSFPGFTEMVERPMSVTLQAHDLDDKPFTIEAEGFLARAFCHEIDHLNGVLFVDRMSRLKRQLIRRKISKAVQSGEWTETYP